METIKFQWDDNKNRINIDKHGISFEEAQSVFYDDNAIEFYDENHSKEEDRFILLGRSYNLHILVVCHCVREKGTIIRLISARKATKNEKEYYRG